MRTKYFNPFFFCAILLLTASHLSAGGKPGVKTYAGGGDRSVFARDSCKSRGTDDFRCLTKKRQGEFREIKRLIRRSKQIILVVNDDWDSVSAVMNCYEKNSGHWRQVFKDIPANLGKKGLGWGKGIIDFKDFGEPQKHEGDRRAPAGIFTLGAAFGYPAKDSLPKMKIAYRRLTGSIECVDDSSSIHYNELLDTVCVENDWKSSEHMFSDDPDYKLGIFINHNVHPALPGRGSCIFIHLWKGKFRGTWGCTAIAENEMLKLMQWADPKKYPIIIQLPTHQLKYFDNVLPFLKKKKCCDG